MAQHLDRGKRKISCILPPSNVAAELENTPIALNSPTQIEQDMKESVDRIEKKFRPNMKTFRKSATTRINQNEKLIRETGILHMPELYIVLCRVFGTPMQVAIRRETSEIMDIMTRQTLHKVCQKMESGSRKEGFRLAGSDIDTMYWPNNHRVIWCKSMSKLYTVDYTLLLGDDSESPPGFTLLEIPTTTDPPFGIQVIQMNGKFVVPSFEFRRDARLCNIPESMAHGPCNMTVQAGVEVDIATCFACDFWPQSASSWLHRSRSLHWPNQEIIDDIVKNGCHVVPIGHPLGLHQHIEWRISFSLAEYKIVKSMNHSQFLVYGLLKIFLKKVINQQSDESKILLCSYYMKTAIFWAIQQNSKFKWCPQNLLEGFWVCFKLLLKWVYEGICPNFFIPQNNMFLSKIYGYAQRNLFVQLYSLYEEGLACLLQDIWPYITDFLCMYNTELQMSLGIETELFSEINAQDAYVFTNDLYRSKEILHITEELIETPLTQYQTAMLQKHAVTTIQWAAFMLHNMIKPNEVCNRFDIPCHMLKVAAKLGLVSDNAYIAIYYYKTKRYAKALSVIGEIKNMLRDTKQCQTGNYCHGYAERYTTASGELFWLTKMVQDIKFSNNTCFIEELRREQMSAKQNDHWVMGIPLFVAIQFVEFLCSRHISKLAAQEALEKLQNLVHRDQEAYVPDIYRDISWEILGICQQMNGDFPAARYSYEQSLKQYPCNKVQEETRLRMNEIATAKNSSRTLVKKGYPLT